MNMFARHLKDTMSQMSSEEPPVIVAPGGDTPVNDPTDPLGTVIGDDEFAQQRARRNADHGFEGIENFQQAEEINGTPVDGTDDDQGTDTVDTDVKLPDGEFGEAPDKTENGNDVEVDADDTEVEFDNSADQELDQIEQDGFAIESLGEEMRMLIESSVAIERFGMNPTAMAIAQTTGLLNSTALESLALESVSFSAGNEAESQMALEAIGEKIKEKTAQWSAKILSVVKGSGEKILSVLGKLWDKISGVVTSLASASWDKAKEAGAVVRAHPYKTALGVIAAIAAVAGIVAFVATGAPAPGAKLDVMKSFLSKILEQIKKIKTPIGNITAKIVGSETTGKIVLGFTKVKGVVSDATLTALGWTQSSVKAMGGQLNRAWDLVKQSWSALGTRATKVASAAWSSGPVNTSKDVALNVGKTVIGIDTATAYATSNTASKIFGYGTKRNIAADTIGYMAGSYTSGAYLTWLCGLVMVLFTLARLVVIDGFRLLVKTVNAIKYSVGGRQTASA